MGNNIDCLKPTRVKMSKMLILALGVGFLCFQGTARELEIDLKAGLVGHWPFDQEKGTVVEDVSDNGHDGQLVNFPNDPWVAGKEGGGLSFNGQGYVALTGLPELQSTTWSAFLKKTETGSYASTMTAAFDGAAAGHILGFESGDTGNNPRALWNHDIDPVSVLSPEPVALNEWVHVAMTLDAASGRLKLYVNGELKDSTEATRTLPFSVMNLGRRVATESHPFVGYMDEVRVYDRALSEAEIRVLSGEPAIPPQITRQPKSQTVYPETPVTFSVEVNGLKPLQFQWFKNGSPLPNATKPTLRLPQPHQADTGTYFVKVTNPLGETKSEAVKLKVKPIDGLSTERIAYWPFDDGKGLTVSDRSGQGMNGKLIGLENADEAWVKGCKGHALKLNGGKSRVIIPDSKSIELEQHFSLSFWLKPKAFSANQGNRNGFSSREIILSNGERLNVSVSITDSAAGGGPKATMTFGSVGDSPASPRSAEAVRGPDDMVEPGAWQHYAIMYRKGEVIFHKDGFPVENPIPITLEELDDATLTIGNAASPRNDSTGFNGLLDELGIWGRVLTAAEILDLAGLNVTGPPSIVREPTPKSEVIGSAVTLSVQAEGKRPVSYQWFLNGEPISGANDATILLDPLTPDKGGSYHVEITNQQGKARSDAVEVNVDPGVVYRKE